MGPTLTLAPKYHRVNKNISSGFRSISCLRLIVLCCGDLKSMTLGINVLQAVEHVVMMNLITCVSTSPSFLSNGD